MGRILYFIVLTFFFQANLLCAKQFTYLAVDRQDFNPIKNKQIALSWLNSAAPLVARTSEQGFFSFESKEVLPRGPLFASLDGGEETVMVLKVVKSVTDAYPLVRSLGKGTYAEVFLARKNATSLAVKIGKAGFGYSKAALREANVLHLLRDNPHCLKIHDCLVSIDPHQELPSPYNIKVITVTERLSKDLSQELLSAYEEEKTGKEELVIHSLTELRKIARAVLGSLEDLHKREFIHTDLKPENIMRCPRGSVRLIDFNGVRHVTNNKHFEVTSLWYRAPEIAKEQPYDQKIDLWSLGCVLFELASNSVLFNAKCLPPQSPAEQAQALLALIESFVAEGRPITAFLAETPLALSLGNTCEYREFLHLLYSLLEPDPRKRISAEAALQHPFVCETSPIVIKVPPQGEVLLNE